MDFGTRKQEPSRDGRPSACLGPLANPYVPFQLENPPKYEARKGLGASLRYLSQRCSMPFDELKGLLTDVGIDTSK